MGYVASRLGAGLAISTLAACAHPSISTECAGDPPDQLEVAFRPAAEIDSNLALVQRRNKKRYEILSDLFRRAGCMTPLLSEKSAGFGRIPNLSCTLRGRTQDTIVVGAHFDKTGTGEGAVDNWSGAALLPSLFLSLAPGETQHTFEFVGFSAEEKGLVGSRQFVASLSEDERVSIRAMVNLDSLGTGPVLAEINHSDPYLVCNFWLASSLLRIPTRSLTMTRRVTSDFEPFLDAGIPVIDFSALTGNIAELLHTSKDSLTAIDRSEYYATYRLLAVFLAFIDHTLGGRSVSPPGGAGANPGGG